MDGQVFMEWTSLTALHLKGNDLVTLPLNFTGLLKIKVAEFDWEHLILPPPEVAKQGNKVVLDYLYQMTIALKRLRLNLSDKGLLNLPVHLTNIERLDLLNLNANKFRLLEPYIESLSMLKTLSMDRNLMPSLPKEFCRLTLLTDLSIVENNLQMLPHDFGKLTHLTSLKLQSNALTELPGNFTELVNLTHLSLRYNRLKALPYNIGGADFSLGPFIPIFMGGLRLMEYLDASNNDLEVVPKSILGMTNLTTLFLDQNPLKAIPDRLKLLKKCDTFTIAIEKLTVLEKLDIQKLDVKIIPPKEVVMRG
jgi:Leucine-rich repeat (LRR) protein